MVLCTLPWALLALTLAEWRWQPLRTAAGWVRIFVERFKAGRLRLDPPVVHFDGAAATLSPSSAGAGLIQCYTKDTQVPMGVVRACSREEVHAAVAAARVAQRKWCETTFVVRRRFLLLLLDYVLAHQELICRTSSIESGKTLMDASLGEVLTTVEKLRWTIANGADTLAPEHRGVGPMTLHKQATVRYVPFGVVGAIVSWNYAFHNIMGPMISAVFAGNGFVAKCSEYTSYYAAFYERIVRMALQQVDAPTELVAFVTGFAEAGEALIDNVDKVTFIGSPKVGKLVMARAATTLTPVVLELGGKDPAVVLDDIDLNAVLPVLLRGTFQNSGQNCVGLERVVAHAAIYDRLVVAMENSVSALRQGADVGAMTMGKAALGKIQELIDASTAAGARCLVGGRSASETYYPPTLLVDVTPTMAIALEEVFGPVLVVMKCNGDEDAIRIVNHCPYGLGANVFSNDPARAARIAARIESGMCNVNDFAVNYLCQSLPFGGVKCSGFDRFAGIEGLRGNCVARAETTDRIPGVRTKIPQILQYPISDRSFAFMSALVVLMYGRLSSSLGAVLAIVRNR